VQHVLPGRGSIRLGERDAVAGETALDRTGDADGFAHHGRPGPRVQAGDIGDVAARDDRGCPCGNLAFVLPSLGFIWCAAPKAGERWTSTTNGYSAGHGYWLWWIDVDLRWTYFGMRIRPRARFVAARSKDAGS
jgi:hypothetical protein